MELSYWVEQATTFSWGNCYTELSQLLHLAGGATTISRGSYCNLKRELYSCNQLRELLLPGCHYDGLRQLLQPVERATTTIWGSCYCQLREPLQPAYRTTTTSWGTTIFSWRNYENQLLCHCYQLRQSPHSTQGAFTHQPRETLQSPEGLLQILSTEGTTMNSWGSYYNQWRVCLLDNSLTSQHHASIPQGRICADSCTVMPHWVRSCRSN